MVDPKVFPSPTDVDKKVCDTLNWTRDNVTHYLTHEDQMTHLVVKELRWIPPSEGRLKLMELLKNEFHAERLPDLKGKMHWKIAKSERREADASQTKESKPINKVHPGESPPAKTVEVPLKSLIYGKYSPRYKANARGLKKPKVDGEHVDRLLDALKAGEELPVPKVRPYERNKVMEEPLYEVVDGEHTCMAYERFGVGKIEVALKPLSHLEALCGALEWNLRHGLPVTHLQEVRQIERMLNECEGVTQDQIAKRLNRSPAWVSNRMALLKITGEEFTRVKPGHARKIVTAHEEDRGSIADKVEREGLSVRDVGAVVEAIREVPEKKDLFLVTAGRPEVYECGVPGCNEGTYNPDRYAGVRLCLSHRDLFNRDPEAIEKLKQAKPSQPKKTEHKEYKPLDDRPWKEKLKVDPSNFELRVERRGQTRKLPMGERHGLITLPFKFGDRTWYLPKGIMVWRANGVVHKGKEDKADRICQALRVLGVRVVETWYERDCDKAADEALDKIERNLKEMGWNG